MKDANIGEDRGSEFADLKIRVGDLVEFGKGFLVELDGLVVSLFLGHFLFLFGLLESIGFIFEVKGFGVSELVVGGEDMVLRADGVVGKLSILWGILGRFLRILAKHICSAFKALSFGVHMLHHKSIWSVHELH